MIPFAGKNPCLGCIAPAFWRHAEAKARRSSRGPGRARGHAFWRWQSARHTNSINKCGRITPSGAI